MTHQIRKPYPRQAPLVSGTLVTCATRRIKKKCGRWKRRPLGLRKKCPKGIRPLGPGAKALFIKVFFSAGLKPGASTGYTK